LKDSDEPLKDECGNNSKLLVIAQVFTIKLDHRPSKVSYNIIIEWMRSNLLERKRLKKNFYVVKSMMKPFGLGY